MVQKFKILVSLFFCLATINALAQNPIIQTKFTADPAPLVFNGTVYLYTTHDEDNAARGMGKFLMKDWLLYTSTDMVNWTDHGAIASLKDFSWGRQDNGAWAPQCIERNGKFYLYCPIQGSGIGILVADSPYGPFKDAIGKRLIGDDHLWNDIDPTVFIDTDGQGYLYWGNPSLWYVKLNKDMISYSGEIVKVIDASKEKEQITANPYHYQEGPWIYKRKENYYLAYASTCCPEGIAYAMSRNATGPWQYKGYLMEPNQKSSGNHPGIIDYKGKSYLFGFNYRLNAMITDKHHERRSICIAELKYNVDGTIQELPWWSEVGVKQLANLNPFERTQAETINWAEGVKTEKDSISERFFIRNNRAGAFIKIKGVDFKEGAKKFETSAVAIGGNAKLEIRIDSQNGNLIGTLPIATENEDWKTVSCRISGVKGIHDLFLIFKEGNFNLDWWNIKKK